MAAFDFDGTLTYRDVLVPFLVGLGGRREAARSMGRSGLTLARQRARTRDDAKAAMLRHVLRGRSAADVEAAGAAYAARSRPQLRPDAVERIEWHRARGHLVLLVSASLGVYLRPLAETLGLDGVEAVELVADDQGVLTGEMTGPNCRGPEKVVRLDRHLARAGADASTT